ncbi:DinB family protein [Thermogemmatispora carboxidivorans]|uniref:DinB family protein n=1 Tax=Thermogemmatispora carboxidivorans TaxID=1382306 RepID=UPI00069C85DE|nr:DinB family protein [Thermogemmatispora carboxidivorans]
MTDHPFVIAPFYKGWDVYQNHLIRAIAPLSAEQLALSAGGDLRSIGQIATHIVAVRARWLYWVLKEGDEQLIAIGRWDRPGQPDRSAAEIVHGLETTWKVIEAALQRWTSADLEEILYDVDEETGEEETFTRQWVIWHLLEHDLHHGGELSFSLGMHGLAAIDL